MALGELFATTTPQHLQMALRIAPNVEVKAAAISLPCLRQGKKVKPSARSRPLLGAASSDLTACQSASDRAPRSASKGDPLVLRFERLAFAPSELVGVAETGRARVDV